LVNKPRTIHGAGQPRKVIRGADPQLTRTISHGADRLPKATLGAGPQRTLTSTHGAGAPQTATHRVGPQQIRMNTPGVGPLPKTTLGAGAPLTPTISLGAAQPQKAIRGAARRPTVLGQVSEPRRTDTDSATGPQLTVLGEDQGPRTGLVLATGPPPIAGTLASEDVEPLKAHGPVRSRKTTERFGRPHRTTEEYEERPFQGETNVRIGEKK